MPNETLLVRTFVELTDTLVADFDMLELLTLLTDRCVGILDIDQAGLMLALPPDDRLHVMASSSEAMRVVELFEIQSDEGPCLDCYHSGEPVVNQNLAETDGRWPAFAPVALQAGFHAVHAIPMRLRGEIIGALNLFQRGTGELERADVVAAQALADIATISILQHRAAREAALLTGQLQTALDSRILIEQAKGIVAQANNVDMQQAFSALRRFARDTNVALSDIANAVVAKTISPESFRQPGLAGRS